jgi:8-oxo-dGTP diphosphatase
MPKKTYCYPFPRPAVTADIVIFRENGEALEVLLVKRAKDPFKGMWAIPGGFVDENEAVEKAAARELLEETGLRSVRLRQFGVFGDPGRDPRGHTISVAYFGIVRATAKAKAADDAAEIGWFPVDRPPKLAFDHRKILRRALTAMREMDR